jgi:hypothetical protein
MASPLFFGESDDSARNYAQTRFEACVLPFRCQLEILFVDDVVALEDATGLDSLTALCPDTMRHVSRSR